MKSIKFLFLLAFIFTITSATSAQTFGVRAGLNYSTFLGDKLPQETHGFSTGFHFGMTYSYDFTDLFSLRSELVYIQNGVDYNYSGQSYYIIRQGGNTPITYEQGEMEFYKLNISNAYISIPIMANIKLSKKWEIFGGPYVNILIGPTGRGELKFASNDRPEDIIFRQSLDFNYGSDKIAEITGRYLGLDDIGIRVDGNNIKLPRFAGAYFQQGEKKGNRFNGLDFGLTAGAHYFLNKGFFIGLQVDYGFLDITNNENDISLEKLNEDKSFIFSDDIDSHFGYHVSFGFRF